MKGRIVQTRIDAQIGEAESKLERLVADRTRIERELVGLSEQRDSSFSRLAEIYLPELGQESIDRMRDHLPLIHGRIEALLREKQAELQPPRGG